MIDIKKTGSINTPFYFYDMELLDRTLQAIKEETVKYGFTEHYAIKANANPTILKTIASYGFGADCVSGGEIIAAVNAGFEPSKIVFAGVGKADWEIETAIDNNIFCFNIESLPEVEVIDQIAGKKGKTVNVEIRVNPNVDAHTHAKITTGLNENKFGINLPQLPSVIEQIKSKPNLNLIGLHFHIGSQITDLKAFENLCSVVAELLNELEAKGISFSNINFGGGLGVDYQYPDTNPIPAFKEYFALFNAKSDLLKGKSIHFELGRAVVAQCGTLISRVLYVKEGEVKKFAILDAGFTDLIRPAMYDAYHHIENLSSNGKQEVYDVVGPICESSDVFGKDRTLSAVQRGDLIAIRTAGAYGEVMASEYNLRKLPTAVFSNRL
ncbi:MAG: diaminopimelate decarboxylase [Paludibacteraceae bacterium]|nr:diaminopimelate decarboxylase [Paludibacteraceae bacterium]